MHFPVVYEKRRSDESKIFTMKNWSGLDVGYRWEFPNNDNSNGDCELLVEVDKIEGTLEQESKTKFELRVLPLCPVEPGCKKEVRVDIFCYMESIVIPIQITVTAVVFGLEIDYIVCKEEQNPDEL